LKRTSKLGEKKPRASKARGFFFFRVIRGEDCSKDSDMVLEVIGLTKRFDDFTAVDGISFGLCAGEIVGLLGPNGAGKSTTIHMLLGLITPSGGEIRIFGQNLASARSKVMGGVNFTAPYVAYPWRITVHENLRVFATLYGLRDGARRIDELLDLFEIGHLKRKPMAQLCSGETTRVGLCKALMNRPELLLLDEPTAYLDPQIASQVRRALLEIQRENGVAILYTLHNVAEVEAMCNRIIFMNHGRIIASGTPIEVTRSVLREERGEPALEEVFLRVAGDVA
jgi:ABC-2 type transport system ATP-binding protein